MKSFGNEVVTPTRTAFLSAMMDADPKQCRHGDYTVTREGMPRLAGNDGRCKVRGRYHSFVPRAPRVTLPDVERPFIP